jgi:protocatechuate 3,4-dioxygenase beta subunit
VLAQDSTATAEATDATAACVVRPAETEGPYFVDEMLNRSDIRIDPSDGSVVDGLPLYLTFRVSQMSANTCTPLEGAQVDVWHCDSRGWYSDETDPGFDTLGQKWLRGYQVTDADGTAAFTTIYPGWYLGRTVHIHFKIRTDPASDTGYEFTSQLFFDDALTDEVFQQEPYAAKGTRNTRNANDGIYANGGDQLLLNLVKQDDGGYAAIFDIALDLSQPSSSDDMFGGGGAPPGGNGGRPGNPPPGGRSGNPPGRATATPNS